MTPHYESRIYGQRLLMARQVRGLSRNALGTICNMEAWRIRAIERSEYTDLEDGLVKFRFSFVLRFPLAFFWTPVPPDVPKIDERDVFVCENADRTTCACGKSGATLLCDAKVGEGTCDAPLCEVCTTKRGREDRCSAHARRKIAEGL